MWSLIRQSVLGKPGIIIQNDSPVITCDIPQLPRSFIYTPRPCRLSKSSASNAGHESLMKGSALLGHQERSCCRGCETFEKWVQKFVFYCLRFFCEPGFWIDISEKINFTKLKNFKIALEDRNASYNDVWKKKKSARSSILYMLLIRRIILGIKPLSPESPGGGSFLLFPLLLCSLIQKFICIIDFRASILLVQGQRK